MAVRAPPRTHRGLFGHPEPVATVLTERAESGDLIRRQLALLADVDPGPAGEVKAAMVFAGMAGAAGPTWGNLDDESLREHLVEAGRRTAGLPAPRRVAQVTAVVTGGGSGIGGAIADRLRADGYHVATIDRNSSDNEFAHTADVTDRGQVEAALSTIRAQLGPVTILVNAAGLDGFKRFTDITFEEWQKVVDVNLNGVFHCVQATIDATPVRRIGRPEDIAAACAFLISEEAGYITGQILGVNGGRNT